MQDDIESILKEELYDCRLIYGGKASRDECAALANAWGRALGNALDLPDAGQRLKAAFAEHKKYGEAFPKPSQIISAMHYAKKVKPREENRQPAAPAGMGQKVLQALRGDKDALEWCKSVWNS